MQVVLGSAYNDKAESEAVYDAVENVACRDRLSSLGIYSGGLGVVRNATALFKYITVWTNNLGHVLT